MADESLPSRVERIQREQNVGLPVALRVVDAERRMTATWTPAATITVRDLIDWDGTTHAVVRVEHEGTRVRLALSGGMSLLLPGDALLVVRGAAA